MNAKDEQIINLQFDAIKELLKSQAETHAETHKNLDTKLTQILEQTTKTNGRVNKIEEWKSDHELSTADQLLEYNFIKKYPKVMLIVFAAMVILTIINIVK